MKQLENILQQTPVITSKLILELISYIDLTSLNKDDTSESIKQLIQLANTGYQNTHPAAVCVFSKFEKLISDEIDNNIKTAVVCSNFPHGQSIPTILKHELNQLNNSNIDDIDFINQNTTKDTASIIELLPSKKIKTILETGTLQTEFAIRNASKIAIKAGSHFIKTSTGTTNTGYTPEALYFMCSEISSHFKTSGVKIGIKSSGGIKTLKQALEIHTIIKQTLGNTWLNSNLFRIGASSLYHNLIIEHKTRFSK